MSSDSSYPTVICEVLQGKNKLGWVVELRFTELETKKDADKFYKLCEKFYKMFTAEMDDSSPTKVMEEEKDE